jgi:hypothetical protein
LVSGGTTIDKIAESTIDKPASSATVISGEKTTPAKSTGILGKISDLIKPVISSPATEIRPQIPIQSKSAATTVTKPTPVTKPAIITKSTSVTKPTSATKPVVIASKTVTTTKPVQVSTTKKINPVSTTKTTTNKKPITRTVRNADGSNTFDIVIKDLSRGKAILRVFEKGEYKIGDHVKIQSPKYSGRYRVWMVYHKAPNYDNVYIETPYVGNDSGTAMKI